MKKILTILLVVLVAQVGLSQNEKPHFCTRDTSDHKEHNHAFDGVFNVDVGKQYNDYVNDQYWFRIAADKQKEAFNVILEIEYTEPENGVYEKLGSFICSELHAPSNKKDVLEKGKYTTAWAFNKEVEIWYNGEYIKLVFPKLTNTNHQSFEHSFYVKKECHQDMLNAFKPNK